MKKKSKYLTRIEGKTGSNKRQKEFLLELEIQWKFLHGSQISDMKSCLGIH